MTDLLQEFCDSRGVALRVDRTLGVVRGVKVLGLHSRNGREYLPAALAQAVGLYEGAKVNVNHPKGHPLAPRDYQERIGVIRNVQHRAGEGLFADFHFNPKHELAEQLAWDAEHAPENVGFSHNVQARIVRRGDMTLVEEIVSVQSVDLVADPATTRGLFESAAAATESGQEIARHTDIAQPESSEGAALTEQNTDFGARVCQEQAAEIGRLRSELDQLRAEAAVRQRRDRVWKLLAEYRLPQPDAADAAAKAIVSDTFIESLLAAPDEATIRRLVEERSRLIGSAKRWNSDGAPPNQRPSSRDQFLLDANRVTDGHSFARAIRD